MKQEEQLLGNIVAKDFRAASVLSKAGLDFCCGGSKTLDALKTIAAEMPGMHGEHELVGGTMDKINEITCGYKVPPDGCNTYAVTCKLLSQFEEDLHIHVHLENNILFTKSLNL
jgi:regulator of cell morphogenesis and NO signaling